MGVHLDKAPDAALAAYRRKAPRQEGMPCESPPDWFHDGQLEGWSKDEPYVLLLCGTQSGKTVFGPHWMLREMARKGPGEYGAASPSFPLMYKKLQPEYYKLFVRELKLARYVGSPAPRFEFTEEGLIKLFGTSAEPCTLWLYYASDPDNLESATLKGFHSDECGQPGFVSGSFEAIDRRLNVHQGRHLMTTTPYEWNYVKTEIYDRWVAGDKSIAVVNFRSIDNPVFPKERADAQKAKLANWRYLMMYEGLFTRPAGQIFDCWSRGANVVKDFPIPDKWPRYIGLDFGPINTAAVMLAEDPDSHAERHLRTLYVYATYKPGEARSEQDHAKAIWAKSGKNVLAIVGGAPSEDEWREKFATVGLPVAKPYISDVYVGINTLYGEIQAGRVKFFESLDGRNHPRGHGIIPEIEGYAWELDDALEPIPDKIANKAKYHRLDALRVLMIQLRGHAYSEVKKSSRLRRGTYRMI